MIGNYSLPLIITLYCCIYRPNSFILFMNTLVCSSAYIGYGPLIVAVTLSLFAVFVVSCTGLYTVVVIYIF